MQADDDVLQVPRAWLDRAMEGADDGERLRDLLQAERMKRLRAEKRADLLAWALEKQARANRQASETLHAEMKRLRQRMQDLAPADVLRQRLDALALALSRLKPP